MNAAISVRVTVIMVEIAGRVRTREVSVTVVATSRTNAAATSHVVDHCVGINAYPDCFAALHHRRESSLVTRAAAELVAHRLVPGPPLAATHVLVRRRDLHRSEALGAQEVLALLGHVVPLPLKEVHKGHGSTVRGKGRQGSPQPTTLWRLERRPRRRRRRARRNVGALWEKRVVLPATVELKLAFGIHIQAAVPAAAGPLDRQHRTSLRDLELEGRVVHAVPDLDPRAPVVGTVLHVQALLWVCGPANLADAAHCVGEHLVQAALDAIPELDAVPVASPSRDDVEALLGLRSKPQEARAHLWPTRMGELQIALDRLLHPGTPADNGEIERAEGLQKALHDCLQQ
mmetsp:Transcript_26528/g.70978  ORF Transcript_26528/g.70978 Transcript_26528/m.70978 type:complete len:345 (-) Transcript_26528:78-1112(-)